MILSGKTEKAFPRGGIAKKNKSESSTETLTKKFKENDDLFSSKHDFVKSKPVSSDSTKGKTKKGKKGEKAEDKDEDILTVKQVNLFKSKRVLYNVTPMFRGQIFSQKIWSWESKGISLLRGLLQLL